MAKRLNAHQGVNINLKDERMERRSFRCWWDERQDTAYRHPFIFVVRRRSKRLVGWGAEYCEMLAILGLVVMTDASIGKSNISDSSQCFINEWIVPCTSFGRL